MTESQQQKEREENLLLRARIEKLEQRLRIYENPSEELPANEGTTSAVLLENHQLRDQVAELQRNKCRAGASTS